MTLLPPFFLLRRTLIIHLHRSVTLKGVNCTLSTRRFATAAAAAHASSFQDAMDRVNTTDRLAALRKLMKEHKVDIYGMFSLFLCSTIAPLLIQWRIQLSRLKTPTPLST
jgi:hypothetical protein